MTGNAFFFAWEEQVLTFFQSFMGGFLKNIAEFFTMIGEELVPVAIVAFVYWCINKQLGRRIGFSVTMASLGFPMIKNIAVRLRPYMVHESIECLRPVTAGAALDDIAAQGYSFPSGHSTMASSTYGAIAAFTKKRWAWCLAFVLPLLIGLSRVCLGVHYPTDVLTGWAFGALCIFLSWLMEKYIKREELRFAILFLVAFPGVFYCQSNDYFTALGLLIGFAAGSLFEQKFVDFSATRRPLIMVLRTLIGLGLYLALTSGLKALFALIFGTTGAPAFAARVLRYALCVFTLIGVYPLFFSVLDRWFPARK